MVTNEHTIKTPKKNYIKIMHKMKNIKFASQESSQYLSGKLQGQNKISAYTQIQERLGLYEVGELHADGINWTKG